MPFRVEDFVDLIRILEERPEWRAELRRLVLTDELLKLPEQIRALTASVERLVEAQARAEERLGRLEEAQIRTEERLQRLEEAELRTEERLRRLEEAHGERLARLEEAQRRAEERFAELAETVRSLLQDVSWLKGDALERHYREHAFAYFSRLVRGAHALSSDELGALLEGAVEQGLLSQDEAAEVAEADVVIRGRRREDGAEVYLVVEVSWGVGPSDVARAARRAELLARAGLKTRPVVAGRAITKEAAGLAQKHKVWQLTDGRILPPGNSAPRH